MNTTCSQCQSDYPRRSVRCPRCAARNEASPFIIGVRLLTYGLVATAIVSTGFLLTRKDQYSGSGLKPMPTQTELPSLVSSPAPSPPQDPRF